MAGALAARASVLEYRHPTSKIEAVERTMPTTLIIGPYRFSFFSADCAEPRHTHVWRDDDEAKVWLDPVKLTRNDGFSRRELREIERLIEANVDLLRRKWGQRLPAGSR